jgi:glycosyltransferase involved in cell wall biosynthesis
MSQSTTFDFEIILHDDASTDETPAILKGFQEKYPDKVTLVQQTENQYSKGEHEVLWYAMSFATGDFIAVCEGDDYWIDPYKLQKQYDVLADNPGINGCFHPTFAEDPEGNRHIFANHASAITTFTAEESILGDGAFCPTASLFFRRDVTRYMSDDLMKMIPCGDYFIQLFSAFSGGLVYLPEPMSVYRTGQVNSFSGSFAKVDWKSKANFYKRLSDSLSIVDEITKAEFSEPLNEMKRRHNRTFHKHMRKHMKSKVKAFFKKKHSTSK